MTRILTFTFSLALIIPSSAEIKKNILLIAIDDLKPTVGAYGDTIARTPNIDRLAARGLLFERAYTNQALCSPSRNSLLVGIRPTTLGIYTLDTHFRLAAPDAVTLPQHFLNHGYRTEAVGKLFHIGQGNRNDEKSWSVPHVRPQGPTYALAKNRPDPGQGADNLRGSATESADVPDETYADGKIAAEIVKRLEAAKERSDTPFFIAAGFVRPHLPFVAPKKYWDLYDRSQLKLPAFRGAPDNAAPYALRPNGELSGYKDTRDANNLSEKKQLELLHAYYAASSYTDAQIGKLLDALDRLGLAESTIVVLWSDHGWHLGDHGLWAKMTNFEQANRIPLIISAPGVTTPGTKTKALAESIDIYPTLVELAGLPAPATPRLEGTSLVPILKHPAASVKEEVLHVIPRQGLIGRALRTPTHRLVEWKKPGDPSSTAAIELYDYVKDPEETKNHAKDQPELVAALREKLAAYPEPKPQIADPSRPAFSNRTRFELKAGDRLQRHEAPNIANRPFTVTTRFDAADGDGVILAQGGTAFGYSLSIHQGKLTFFLRNRGRTTTLALPEPLSGAQTATASLARDGTVTLTAGGQTATAKRDSLIPTTPLDALDVGDDTSGLVGPYEVAVPYPATIHSILVELDRP